MALNVSPDQDSIEKTIETLRFLADEPTVANEHPELVSLIVKVYKNARRENRRAVRETAREIDRRKVEQTGRCLAEKVVTTVEPARPLLAAEKATIGQELIGRRTCYICNEKYSLLDNYYHSLCPECAAINQQWRNVTADMTGRTVLLTGGRIKIGFQVALRLLQCGASVVATTRFPADAARRYWQQPDFSDWQDRLQIVQLDLLDLPMTIDIAKQLTKKFSFDCLINNAAQTISRPPAYYQQLIQQEASADRLLLPPSILQLERSPATPGRQLLDNVNPFFPNGLLSPDGQPLDMRPANSWTMEFTDVPMSDLLTTHVINTFAPFALIQEIYTSMITSNVKPKFIINVSAMEGQFSRTNKTTRHVHTNMAKAAMNMITRTSAAKFAENDVYMNSVDTGWVTEENPFPIRKRKRESGFVPPLDEIDGAARVLAPIFEGLRSEPAFGQFFKDFKSVPW